jgi:DNA-binding winged helix-turn-helix (wHTH) protein/TolB-like protein
VPSPDRAVRFDDFEFDRETLELKRAGVAVKLQQQPARVLALLLEHAGDLVTRDALQKSIWGDGTFVDFERGVNYCVSQIRTVLGDTADAPRYVETLRGRGYRFIGTIAAPAATRRRFTWRVAIAAVAFLLLVGGVLAARREKPREAIGVAPLTAPANERQWAAALHAQIVSRLASASRTPVVDLAASSASTRWRLEGRVDSSADIHRVTLILRDTTSGAVRWSDVFAGSPGEWVEAQSEMADRMTRAIRYSLEGPAAGLPMRRAHLGPRSPMPKPAR